MDPPARVLASPPDEHIQPLDASPREADEALLSNAVSAALLAGRLGPEGTDAERAVLRAARSREGDKGGGAAGEGGPEDGARSYLLWSDDEPGGTDSTKATP